MKAILSIGLNPTMQKTLVFSGLVSDTVNRAVSHRLDASGKGINVCRVLTQLGKNSVHLSQLGGRFRPVFLDLCAADGLNVEWVESQSQIRFCYTLIDSVDRSVTELVEEGEEVESGTEARLIDAYKKLLPGISTVIFSGSKAAGFSDSLMGEMVKLAKSNSIRIILDIRGKDLLNSLQHKPDIIKPNLVEFASTFAPELIVKNKIPDVPEVKSRIEGLCVELCNKYNTGIVLTRGAKSIWYMDKSSSLGNSFSEFKIDCFEPLNTTGSGDAFTAGMASALEEGKSLGQAVAEGARCGGLNALLLRPGVIREH